MRRLLFSFFLFLIVSSVYAQTYEVRVRSTLNVRSSPGQFASAIGTLHDKDTIYVHEIQNGWAKIGYNGQEAYVNAGYIHPVTDAPDLTPTAEPFSRDNLVYALLGLSVFLLILRRVRKERIPSAGIYLVLFYLTFIIICALEFFYFFRHSFPESIWFCTPDQVGWLWTVINFVLFALVLLNQYSAFGEILVDLQSHSAAIDYRLGIYSYALGLILLILGSLFFPKLQDIVIPCWLVAQGIQIGIIFYRTWRFPVYAVASVVIYVVGSVATIVLFIHFLPLLVVVFAALLALSFFGGGGYYNRYGSHTSGR